MPLMVGKIIGSGQVTIPKEIREELGVEIGDRVMVDVREEQGLEEVTHDEKHN